jgi:hypothetical protein
MKKTLVLSALSGILSVATLSASWMTFELADRVSYNNTAMTHLDDGRLVYAHDGSVYQQDTFGDSTMSSYSNAPTGDYGYITGNGFLGAGGFSAASIYGYTATNTATSFSSIGSQQNYAAVAFGADILISGGNGAGVSEIGHFSSAGVYTTVVDNVSTYSAGLTLDSAGNLYVADNDDNNIYRYTAAQVSAALLGATLAISDGEFITNLGVGASLAIDSMDRLYAAGWQTSGIQVYDLITEEVNSIIPALNNTNYSVTTFSDGANDYVGWLNAEGFALGDGVVYGYDLDGSIVVPEPATYALLAGFACLGLVALRRRR